MNRKECTASFENAVNSEEPIRKLLLKNANMINLREARWSEIGFFYYRRFGGPKDKAFAAVLESLKPHFIRKKDGLYSYNLSPKIKKAINQTTLLWNCAPPLPGPFYGFEDIMFYKDDILLGMVITHEPIITVHVTDPELQELEQKGVKFDYRGV